MGKRNRNATSAAGAGDVYAGSASVVARAAQLLASLRGRLLPGAPVEHLDRTPKAMLIDAVLQRQRGRAVRGFDLLDIGCGNGDICRFFARQGNRVTGVDVADRRRNDSEEFQFRRVASEQLPFPNASFDVVVSHHVIEHVTDQRGHLDEIHRVLRPEGICYLATPNRSSPIMRGHVGNPMVLRYGQMRALFEERRFHVVEHSTSIFVRPDLYHYPLPIGLVVPRRLAEALRELYPSHMFTLTKIDETGGSLASGAAFNELPSAGEPRQRSTWMRRAASR